MKTNSLLLHILALAAAVFLHTEYAHAEVRPSLTLTAGPLSGTGRDTLLLSDFLQIRNPSRKVQISGLRVSGRVDAPLTEGFAFIGGVELEKKTQRFLTSENPDIGLDWIGQTTKTEQFYVYGGIKVEF